ncbi:MAG: MarR family winged helix-turn-helix transcriptional regulator [Streptosporangiaceae bacterium]
MSVDQVPEPSVADGCAAAGAGLPGGLPDGAGLPDGGLPDCGLLPGEAAPEAVSLAGLPEAERRRTLVAETARFTSAFLRWMEGRACGGLTYARLRLLQALHCGGPAIMRDLGVQLGVSPRNMTAMVDALEDAQLVVRRPHPTDRRATLVELSPDGAREAEQALEPRLDAMAELFEGFSAAEQQAFADALARLGRAMQARQGDY